MIISPANISYFFTALDTTFWQAFQNAPVWSPQIATTYPTGTEQWVMGWIGMLDKLRVWKGARIVRTPAPQTYGVTILPFELTEAIDKFKLEDDTYGIYTPMIAHMGEESKKWPDYALRDLLEATGDFASTAAQLGTDGVSHWSGSHPVDFYDSAKGTYPNDYGASGTTVNSVTVGGAFSPTAYASVWTDHANRKNESGEKIGVLPDLTMVPTYLQFHAKTLLQAVFFSPQHELAATTGQTYVGAMDNQLRGSSDLLVNPDLSSQVAWYMFTTKKTVKPLGWVLRAAPQLTPRVAPTDPSVFDSHQYLYGVEARACPAWSLPWLSSRSGI